MRRFSVIHVSEDQLRVQDNDRGDRECIVRCFWFGMFARIRLYVFCRLKKLLR